MRVRVGIRADTYIPGGQIGNDIDILATGESPVVYEFKGQLDRFEKVLATPSNFPGLMITVRTSMTTGLIRSILDLRLNEQERTE